MAVVVIGAGPGIGQAVARRFAFAGRRVAVIARRPEPLQRLAAQTGAFAVPADVTDPAGLRSALDKAAAEHGPAEVVVYNAGLIRAHSIADPVTDHLHAWAINVGGAITTAAHVLPAMAARGSGTLLFTGGMPAPDPAYLSLSVGKAALRALTEALHREYSPVGVHVSTVTVGGAVAPGTAYDPDDIAEHYWRLSEQAQDDWQPNVTHG